MSDVFISYSRRDKAFVQDLHQALTAQNRDVWIDWEDIPATADWWKEIQEGMDGANNVLFIISPDSAESKICQDEVAYAVSSNKRLIPVLYKSVAGNKGLHPRITSHNWVIFEGADFKTAFTTLVKAMDTDLEHVRSHTRILTKAREWEEHGRNHSYLLSGVDLDAAEIWLGKSGDKEPFPTPLQSEYILASRKAQRARQQQLLIASVVAVVISLSLAALSFVLGQVAASERDLAYEARDTAEESERLRGLDYEAAVAAQHTAEFFMPRVNIVPNRPINLYAIPSPDGEVLGQITVPSEVILFGITPDEEFFFVEANDIDAWMWTRDLANNSDSVIRIETNIALFDPRNNTISFSRRNR